MFNNEHAVSMFKLYAGILVIHLMQQCLRFKTKSINHRSCGSFSRAHAWIHPTVKTAFTPCECGSKHMDPQELDSMSSMVSEVMAMELSSAIHTSVDVGILRPRLHGTWAWHISLACAEQTVIRRDSTTRW